MGSRVIQRTFPLAASVFFVRNTFKNTDAARGLERIFQMAKKQGTKNNDAARGLERIFQMAKKQADTLEDLMQNLETELGHFVARKQVPTWDEHGKKLK